MDNLRASIEVLFSKVNPEQIIQQFLGRNHLDLSEFNDWTKEYQQEHFVELSEPLLIDRNKDELKAVYKIIYDEWSISPDSHLSSNRQRKNVFYLIQTFAEKVLFEEDEKPVVKFKHLLRWRDLSYKIGKDIFTTAFFAYKDLASKRERHYFSWNAATLPTNNQQLQEVFEKGITDIHLHLQGSSLNFDINWLSLMNYIIDRDKEFAEIRISKMPYINPYFGEAQLSLYAMCIKAFTIRQMLFRILIHELKCNDNEIFNFYLPTLRCGSEDELRFYTPVLQEIADRLRYMYGKKYENESVDYAIKRTFSDKNYDADSYNNSILYGERWMMYKMFNCIFSTDDRAKFKPLFYAYLIIKIRLRDELIQINSHIGFRNFQEYQKRKTLFLDNKSVYENLLINVAVKNALLSQHVKYLEVRIAPQNTLAKNMQTIQNFDDKVHTKQFHRPLPETPKGKLPPHDLIIDELHNATYIDYKNKYFYIYHFIKQPETERHLSESIVELVLPRHHQLRYTIKEQAMAINLMRRQSSPDAKVIKERLVGIDAANFEIGCRPEIFAQAFRYLKNYSLEMDNLFLTNSSQLLLGYTYHVGEDFLDITDGLRAIDETVKFLNFQRGDRLGHALALGANPQEYYEKRNYQIVLPKQDLLDNTVWLLMQIKIYNITTSQSLMLELRNRFATLIHEIYDRGVIRFQLEHEILSEKEGKLVDIANLPPEIYYLSWLLRGDDPKLYFDHNIKLHLNKETSSVECFFNPITFWERCGINYLSECREARKNISALSLYIAYHFNDESKQRGKRTAEFKVNADYIKLVRDIQDAMMQSLAKEHISIETNPTSNKLIGSYGRYADHPLARFFNLGLTYDPDTIAANPQLSVSINTDDLGVFATSIENEYALMAAAMEKETDENGNPKYNSRMIYDWLDRIRCMGFEQRFKKI